MFVKNGILPSESYILHETTRGERRQYFHRTTENQLADQQPTPRGPKRDPTGMLSADFSKYKLEKIVVGGKGKKK